MLSALGQRNRPFPRNLVRVSTDNHDLVAGKRMARRGKGRVFASESQGRCKSSFS